jgi:hypothetical protein
LKIDTYLTEDFSQQNLSQAMQIEILSKAKENILNMARFDFENLLDKKPYMARDIFLLTEVLNGHCAADMLLFAANRIDDLDALVQ